MLKRILAIALIFIATSIAWMILGTTIYARTDSFGGKLRSGVASVWGEPQVQHPLAASFDVVTSNKTESMVEGKTVTKVETVHTARYLPAESSGINVALALQYRQKGLLWYSTYTVDFAADYTFKNPETTTQNVLFELKFPAQRAIYDAVSVDIDGKPSAFTANQTSVLASQSVLPGQTALVHVSYRSHGLESWSYKMSDDVSQWRNFKLAMKTNFKDIDFPADTLSPITKVELADGWQLIWQYKNLISGFAIGMSMPEKLQPGPLAGQISYFAPVSLLLFFFVLFTITALRQIELHPMNYFFLAAAFFSFHLLLAYLVDRVSIHVAFLICSAVSIALVISYLRLVVGLRFAMVEAGLAQFIYLVLFSYSFFINGFTGLAITVGCIVTLFVAMQVTGTINWKERFQGSPLASAPR